MPPSENVESAGIDSTEGDDRRAAGTPRMANSDKAMPTSRITAASLADHITRLPPGVPLIRLAIASFRKLSRVESAIRPDLFDLSAGGDAVRDESINCPANLIITPEAQKIDRVGCQVACTASSGYLLPEMLASAISFLQLHRKQDALFFYGGYFSKVLLPDVTRSFGCEFAMSGSGDLP